LLLLTVEAFQPLNFATPFNRNSLDSRKSNPTQQTSKSNPLQATQQSISSTASTTSTTSNPSNLGCWLPVASVSGIEDLLPMNVKIANIDCVVWKDSNENWAVQKDECAHRLVSLSQGRISEDGGGRIECPYHGWQFNTTGQLQHIPQAPPSSSSFCFSDDTSLTNFETHVTDDLLWAFFPSMATNEFLDKAELPETVYPSLMSAPLNSSKYFVRELPYSFDFLVENFMDPAHIPFAHHGLQGVRSDGCPIPMRSIKNAVNYSHVEVSFEDTIREKPRTGIVSFQRPCYYHFRTQSGENGEMKPNLQIFVVPIHEGRCRVLFVSPLTKSFIPNWLEHAASNRFLNTDIWLHEAEITVRNKMREEGRDGGGGDPVEMKMYQQPTSSDNGVRAWRKWWKEYGMSASPKGTFGAADSENMVLLTRKDQIDPWEGHSKDCSHCRRAMNKFKKAIIVAKLSRPVLGISFLLKARFSKALSLNSMLGVFIAVEFASLLTRAFSNKAIRIITGEEAFNVNDRSASALS
ncbi:hypothetical protein TL16_g05848, partial [Triparma laevis f. inornata]